MKYYKTMQNGVIVAVGQTNDIAELPRESKWITKSEYKALYTIFTINPYFNEEEDKNVSVQD